MVWKKKLDEVRFNSLKRSAFLIFCAIFSSLHSLEIAIDPLWMDTRILAERNPTSLTLEHGDTKEKREWGLMGRKYLPQNQGMLLYLSSQSNKGIWMFNCFIDLSVAALDAQHVIREMHELKAYPEKMDPQKPVNSLNDLKAYQASDATCRFFRKESLKLPPTTSYALEMNKGWFSLNRIKQGDVLCWNQAKNTACILHTLDLSDYLAWVQEKPILLPFDKAQPRSAWLPHSEDTYDVAFLDKNFYVIKFQALGGKTQNLKAVIYSDTPISYILIAPEGWHKTHQLQTGSRLVKKSSKK